MSMRDNILLAYQEIGREVVRRSVPLSAPEPGPGLVMNDSATACVTGIAERSCAPRSPR